MPPLTGSAAVRRAIVQNRPKKRAGPPRSLPSDAAAGSSAAFVAGRPAQEHAKTLTGIESDYPAGSFRPDVEVPKAFYGYAFACLKALIESFNHGLIHLSEFFQPFYEVLEQRDAGYGVAIRKYWSNRRFARVRPVSVRTMDFALFFGSKIQPFS